MRRTHPPLVAASTDSDRRHRERENPAEEPSDLPRNEDTGIHHNGAVLVSIPGSDGGRFWMAALGPRFVLATAATVKQVRVTRPMLTSGILCIVDFDNPAWPTSILQFGPPLGHSSGRCRFLLPLFQSLFQRLFQYVCTSGPEPPSEPPSEPPPEASCDASVAVAAPERLSDLLSMVRRKR